MTGKKLTHLDAKGRASMVDVSAKKVTARTATARGRIVMEPETLKLITGGGSPRAMRSKSRGSPASWRRRRHRTSFRSAIRSRSRKSRSTSNPMRRRIAIEVEATVKLSGQTGVEMEALTAVSVACLTIYDMAKAVDRSMQIDNIRLTHKAGGKSGTYKAK